MWNTWNKPEKGKSKPAHVPVGPVHPEMLRTTQTQPAATNYLMYNQMSEPHITSLSTQKLH